MLVIVLFGPLFDLTTPLALENGLARKLVLVYLRIYSMKLIATFIRECDSLFWADHPLPIGLAK